MLRFLGWESILTDISAEVIRVHIIANYFSCLHTIYTIFIQNYPPCIMLYFLHHLTNNRTKKDSKYGKSEIPQWHDGQAKEKFFFLCFFLQCSILLFVVLLSMHRLQQPLKRGWYFGGKGSKMSLWRVRNGISFIQLPSPTTYIQQRLSF